MSTGFSNPLLSTEGSNSLGDREHLVQFYEEGAFIADSVGGLLATALQQGRGAVVIATKRQRDAIERTLKQKGVAVEAAAAQGQYVSLDAAETLSQFMVNDWPDAALFTSVIGGVLAGVSSGFPGVRIFGEMVALLWAEGKQDATIQLEKLWNELAKTHFFSLCCCYPATAFRREADGEGLLGVCAQHSKALPSESYLTLESSDERLRAIAHLQQQANALATEVAERKGIERQLGRREKELADFLENAVEGLHKVGPDGVILWANQAELNLLGYSADEYIGHPIAKFHADAGVIASILDRLSRGETLYDFPARLRCKDGSVKHVLIHSNVLWEDGKFVHTRCFTRDVTEKVKLEKELRRKLEQLADADRRKDEFLALLAHELRNPLAPLSDAATLLARKGDDPEIRRKLQEVMQRQIGQMARLIEDLTDVSRINQGKITLRKEPVELQSLLRSATQTLLLPAEESSHVLEIQLPEEPLPIHADAVRMTQVVLNLLNNARKYTPPGGHIVLTARRDGPNAVVSVKDDGIGIPADKQSEIFETFAQLNNSLQRGQSGLGLGLTLVKSLVEMHGGSVTVYSEGLGKGSEFTVSLPLSTMERKRPSQRKSQPSAKESFQIVILDDSKDLADMFAMLLEQMGHDVKVFYDGPTALDFIPRERPEIVFSDIAMPKMHGYEFAKRLRQTPGSESLVLVALSGFGTKEDHGYALSQGFDYHFVKPVSTQKLEQLFEEVAGNKSAKTAPNGNR